MYRTTDPETSKLAADAMKASGLDSVQKQEILEILIGRRSCMTARELDIAMEAERYTACKRLPELERAGLIRRVGNRPCSVTGRTATTWQIRKSRSQNS